MRVVVVAAAAVQRCECGGAAAAAAVPGQLCLSCHILAQRAAEDRKMSACREAPETCGMVRLSLSAQRLHPGFWVL